ncbi:discoidin domain-containing protein [Phytohabitans kaempferiae]|uniref:Discoidin domain-containing protein n=1 Tax=Phytohabitans kaempferiae TaxID=1620943 RepID=A0ABV6LXN0_9ACTN
MSREQRGRTPDEQPPVNGAPPEQAKPGGETSPGWLTDTGRFRRLGSALNWVGDRVAVVGADPAGVVAAAAAGLAAEPGVVTVIGPLDTAEDWSFLETVLPIAVPPGSHARVAVAGAADRGLAGRLARELTATLEVPRAEVLLVPGGSLFAVDGWLRHTSDGVVTSAGHRIPRPPWESDIDGLCATMGPGELVLLPVPAGMWLFRRLPGTPMPEYDDSAYCVPMDAARPVLLIGRPGQPEPAAEAIIEVLGRLPSKLRRHLALAPYGSAATTAAAAASLARESGGPVQVHTGLPALTLDGQPTSLAIDHSAAAWEPVATALSFPPDGPARPIGPVRGLDGYPNLGEHVFRLGERWVAEVTQSGLWVRPPEQEHGARLVRSHSWTSGKVRIFVGLPGKPPRYHVLPVLGALLGRMPAETRRRVELSPARFAVAAGDDVAPTPDPDKVEPAVLAVQQAVVLREPRPAADGVSGDESTGPVRPLVDRSGATGRIPAVPGGAAVSRYEVQPAAAGDALPDPVPAGDTSARLVDVESTVDSTAAAERLSERPDDAERPDSSERTANLTGTADVTGTADDETVPLADLPVRRVTGWPGPVESDRAGERTAEYPVLALWPRKRHDAVSVPSRRPGTPGDGDPQWQPSVAASAGSSRQEGGRRRRVPRLSAQILAAVGVLTVAVATGHVLSPTAQPFDVDADRIQASPPSVQAAIPPSPPAVDISGPVATGTPTEAASAPGSFLPQPGGPTGAPPDSAASTRGATAGGAEPKPKAPAQASPSPRPVASSAMPGRVNSSGRNLARSGTASASSFETVFVPASAIDGDQESRWGSEFAPNSQWLAVDLGELWQVTQVRLLWERAYATAYRVEVSTDGRTWRTVYQTNSGAGGSVEIAITRTPARYVRMVGTAKAMTGYGYSIHEFEVR